MVKIRLFRIGKKHAPFYRIVVANSRAPRDSKYIEKVGWYNPRGKELNLELGKIKEWMARGAQPTPAVVRLIKRKEEVQDERAYRTDG